MTQLDMFSTKPPAPPRNDMPTRTPDPRATADWAERARAFQVEHPDVVQAYFDNLDALAQLADANGETRIVPRGAWEHVRAELKVRMPNAYQAEYTRQWQVARPQWAGMIRNGRR
jgi:hypothetical protein